MKNGVCFLLCLALMTAPAWATDSESSQEKLTSKQMHVEALKHWKKGDFFDARRLLRTIVLNDPEYSNIDEVKEDLLDAEIGQILAEAGSSFLKTTTVGEGDVLERIARKNNTTVEMIKVLNRLKSDTIYVGQKLKVWTATPSIVVDKSQNILFLKGGDKIIKAYPVSTGLDNSTPTGTFTIINKLVDPVWYTQGAVVEPDSPENALGTRWLGFDKKGYGIHGTIHPDSIGYQLSAGCIRLLNEDVEELYRIVPPKTKVTVVD